MIRGNGQGLRNILPFRRSPAQKGWCQDELAECFRVVDLLARNGLGVAFQTGVSDEGDPWGVVLRADSGEVLIHIARVDGQFVVASAAGPAVQRGRNLRAVLDELLSGKVLSLSARRQQSEGMEVLRLHPAAVLASLIVAAWLHTEEVRDPALVADDHDEAMRADVRPAEVRAARGGTPSDALPHASTASVVKAAAALAAVAALESASHAWTPVEVDQAVLADAISAIPPAARTERGATAINAVSGDGGHSGEGLDLGGQAAHAAPPAQDMAATHEASTLPAQASVEPAIVVAAPPAAWPPPGAVLLSIDEAGLGGPMSWTSAEPPLWLAATPMDGDDVLEPSTPAAAAQSQSPSLGAVTAAAMAPTGRVLATSGEQAHPTSGPTGPTLTSVAGGLAATTSGQAGARAVLVDGTVGAQGSVQAGIHDATRDATRHGGAAGDATLGHDATPFYRGAAELLSLDKPVSAPPRVEPASGTGGGGASSPAVHVAEKTTPASVSPDPPALNQAAAPAASTSSSEGTTSSSAPLVGSGGSAEGASAAVGDPAALPPSGSSQPQAMGGGATGAATGGTTPLMQPAGPPPAAAQVADSSAKQGDVVAASAAPRPTNGDLLLDFTLRDENVIKGPSQAWGALVQAAPESASAARIVVFDADWLAGRAFMLMPGVAMMENDLLDPATRARLDSTGETLTLDLGDGLAIKVVGVLEA